MQKTFYDSSSVCSTLTRTKNFNYVCRSCGTRLLMLKTECHNSHKHSESPLIIHEVLDFHTMQ